VSHRPYLESGALRQMQGLPEQAFDMLVTLLVRICDDPYDPVFSAPTGVPRRRVADIGDAWLTPRRGLLEQLAELDLRGPFGLAGLAEPDLAARQRIDPGVHLHAPGSAGESLYVSGRWGGWGSNPRPADYENYGPVHRTH
jgi:hypothetical protein